MYFFLSMSSFLLEINIYLIIYLSIMIGKLRIVTKSFTLTNTINFYLKYDLR